MKIDTLLRWFARGGHGAPSREVKRGIRVDPELELAEVERQLVGLQTMLVESIESLEADYERLIQTFAAVLISQGGSVSIPVTAFVQVLPTQVIRREDHGTVLTYSLVDKDEPPGVE